MWWYTGGISQIWIRDAVSTANKTGHLLYKVWMNDISRHTFLSEKNDPKVSENRTK